MNGKVATIVLLLSTVLVHSPQDKPSTNAAIRVASVLPARVQPEQQAKETIFYDDFDALTAPDARYLEYHREKDSFLRRDGDGYGGRGAAMKCRFEKGQVEAGNLKVVFGKNPLGRNLRSEETFREIYWRVYIKHETGWQGNPAKLARATCLASDDWSQGFIAHVWGGEGDRLCIDPATGIRESQKVSTRYNDFAHLRWLGLRLAQTPIFSTDESGRWVCVESHIRLNTPGRSDGVFELWLDGKKEATRTDLDWHGNWDEYAINAVFLENYWNDGSVKRQARWFDNFVISTRPIGPITADTSLVMARTPQAVAAWEAQAATDATGAEVIWSSKTQKGDTTTLPMDAKHGTFGGNRRTLAANTIHWLRLRERNAAGVWSAWTAWHSPFRTSP